MYLYSQYWHGLLKTTHAICKHRRELLHNIIVRTTLVTGNQFHCEPRRITKSIFGSKGYYWYDFIRIAFMLQWHKASSYDRLTDTSNCLYLVNLMWRKDICKYIFKYYRHQFEKLLKLHVVLGMWTCIQAKSMEYLIHHFKRGSLFRCVSNITLGTLMTSAAADVINHNVRKIGRFKSWRFC